MLVYTTGNGVFGFTYEYTLGEFYLSHPNIKIPKTGSIYSVNEGAYYQFPDFIKNYIIYCKEQEYSARYIGSLVADFHRNMLRGGVYLYLSTLKNPSRELRLMYECNALAFLVEQAGGCARNGRNIIMEIQLESLHQRTPLFIGSADMVKHLEALV